MYGFRSTGYVLPDIRGELSKSGSPAASRLQYSAAARGLFKGEKMGAYDIDAATAGRIIGDTEVILQQNENIFSEVQGLVDDVETALRNSRVLGAFSTFATESLMHDIEAVVVRSDNALFATQRAVNEYAAGDYEMFANAQRAAASQGILLPPTQTSWELLPAPAPAAPPEPVPAGLAPAPAPLPAPVPVPLPGIIGSDPGVVIPGNTVTPADPPVQAMPVLPETPDRTIHDDPNIVRLPKEGQYLPAWDNLPDRPGTGSPDPEADGAPSDPPVYRTLPAYLPEADFDISDYPVAKTLPAYLPEADFDISDYPVAKTLPAYLPELNIPDHSGAVTLPLHPDTAGRVIIDDPNVVAFAGEGSPQASPAGPPVVESLLLKLPEGTFQPSPAEPPILATPLIGVFEPPQVGIPIPETGTPEHVVQPMPLIVPGPEAGSLLPGEPTPPVDDGSPLLEAVSRADQAPTEAAPSPARRGRWGLT